ncbi:hypothetical protein BDP27DRAFT_366083 [Rhodocollybia butyracea]|uniref:BHLH domain-containing protein n=1 Tax=Rhodocollybia butyracea TaxID=206335 RepID=A0A9P5TZ72_9AGAR|nr:hypothetical protein BDP27DRAFT_366083 [Rhodocollybia butyracea]
MLSDGQHFGRRPLGPNPESSSPSGIYATTGRRSNHFNPVSGPTTRACVLAASMSPNSNDDSDEGEEEDYAQSPGSVDPILREAVRRERIEADQKRRDNLRDGFASLRSTLPPTNQKSSKTKVLVHAVKHIRRLEAKLETANNELNAYRLRDANEVQAWYRHSSYQC